MPNYNRHDGDMKYRKVTVLEDKQLPEFKDFTGPGESVQYMDYQVLEVLCADGTRKLIHDPGVVKVNATPGGANKFLLDKNIPLARVWIRRSDGTGIPYKVPTDLPVKGNSMEFRVPGGVQEMELFGDEYFEKVFHF